MTKFTTQQLNNLVDSALDTLKKDRDKEVLRRRGGINVEPQTLEQIGQDLNITRERVRQIEKAALSRLQENSKNDHDFAVVISDIINKKGGLISLSSLTNEIDVDSTNEPHAVFLIKINPELVYIDKNDHYSSLVGDVEVFSADKVKGLHSNLVQVIKSNSKPAKFESIYKLIDGPHSQETLLELAKSSSLISELDGFWGLTVWPEVNPKSIRDKIYLVLKKTGRPMHFSDIADKISTLAANPKKVTTQAVHNELIKDKRFVLIGRGIYALAEWGYRSGTVADIIEEVLKEEGGPLSKDEIVKRVLARRQVKTTTIVLNLQEKPQFKRVEKGVYALASQ
jgi:hypothetical protein